MHELFTQVLNYKDLSKAGDLFTVPDDAIVNDLSEVINIICEITSLPDYVYNDNDQSVVEICITRVTTAIRETGSMEQHAEALVTLLESCLNHNLKPSQKEEDPPHAKISSDIISCLFLNYSKKEVMKRVLPVAVKFLHKGNKVLSTNMASYLSLAAIENSPLLSNHIQLIIDSIISGNYPLCRVLPQIYEVTKDPIHDHAMALVSLLPLCELPEQLALLQLCSLIANSKSALLEASLPQLCEYLCTSQTVVPTLQVFLNLAKNQPQLLSDYVLKIKKAAECNPNSLCIAAQVLSAVGKINKSKAQEALNFIMENLPKIDRGSQSLLVREATFLCSCFPILFTDKILDGVLQISRNTNSHVNQTSSGVTIVKVGGNQSPTNSNIIRTSTHIDNVGRNSRVVITPRPRLMADSRSTGRLHSSNAHRSMTRLNTASGSRVGSVGGLHKSMTKLSSNQVCTANTSNRNKPATAKISSGGVTVTTPLGTGSIITTNFSYSTNSKDSLANSVSQTLAGRAQNSVSRPISTAGSSPLNQSLTSQGPTQSSGPSLNVDPVGINTGIYSTVTPRRNHNTSVTIINSNRISVFEPYPMRDTMQHFCEKHLDKIRAYIEKVSVRIPPPAKCIIEERRAKKTAKIHFACEGRGYKMSDRSRYVFGNQYLQQNRCALCLTEDDRNPQNTSQVCHHNTSVESALHYLRNYVAPLSPTYGSVPYQLFDNGSTQSVFSNNGGTFPNISHNYYTVAEFLLRMNRMQQENSGGGHNFRPPPMSSRPSKPKSEMGCLRECAFCKSNGETAEFYKSHFLKDPVGRVRCPILQRYQCPFCYATGENAHTRRYCPKNPNKMCFMKGGEQLVVKQNLQ